MNSTSAFEISAAARRWMSMFVILVLAMSASLSSWIHIQGARHVHELPVVVVSPKSSGPAINFSTVIGRVFVAPSGPVFAHAQTKQDAHFHNDPEHHHHDASDTSVVAADAPSSFEIARTELEASASKAGFALWQPSLSTRQPPLTTAATSHSPWCETPRWAAKTSEPQSLRRPPKHLT